MFWREDRKKQRQWGLIAVLLMLVLSGCTQAATRPATPEAAPTSGKEAAAAPQQKRTVTDMAGRQVEVPTQINRVYSAAPTGTILLYTLVPEKMVGWNYQLRKREGRFIEDRYKKLPNLGGWYSSNTGNAEEIIKATPDIIIFYATTKEKDKKQADEIQKQLGIPVVMINGELTKLAEAYQFAGDLLGVPDKAKELGEYCQKSLADIQERAGRNTNPKVRVYYAEGDKGLETDPKDSPHTQVLNLVGGINVAEVELKQGKGLTQVSLEQIINWNPDVIISWDDERGGYFSGILKDSKWKSIQAVQNKRVYQIPNSPFNWFDRPPSVNRILGLKWLGHLLYPDVYPYDMKQEAKEFYQKFYHYNLSDQEVQDLLADAMPK